VNKRNPLSFAHLNRFNGDKEGAYRSKQEKVKMFRELCSKGPTVMIDCEFEHLMLEPEIKSMASQLAYVYSSNKRMEQPCNLVVTGVDKEG
jgi:hypothetical protein